MAITINTTPNALSSVFQPILFNVSSDKANAELKIRCKVQYYQDSTWKTLTNLTIDKNGAGTFDCYVHQALNAALAVSLPQGIHEAVVTDSESLIKFRVRFTELIYDADDLYSESDTSLSSEYHCSNIIFQTDEEGSPSDFQIIADDGSFLTGQSLNRKIRANQPVIVSYIYDEGSVTPLPELTVSP